jgi:O-6-methylguanine DNA methyltransferase
MKKFEEIQFAQKPSALEKAVWQALTKIPRGETRNYSEIAEMAGYPRAVRAVASAIGRNPFPVTIPCHRVIRKDGSLGGFALGLEMKKKLLREEGVNC